MRGRPRVLRRARGRLLREVGREALVVEEHRHVDNRTQRDREPLGRPRLLALERATPTRVANTMTVNPIAAALLATQLVGEPITPNLVLGLIAVFAGIWIATSEIKKS